MNYPVAEQRGIKKANAHGESGTDPRVGVLTKKRINKKQNAGVPDYCFYLDF